MIVTELCFGSGGILIFLFEMIMVDIYEMSWLLAGMVDINKVEVVKENMTRKAKGKLVVLLFGISESSAPRTFVSALSARRNPLEFTRNSPSSCSSCSVTEGKKD